MFEPGQTVQHSQLGKCLVLDVDYASRLVIVDTYSGMSSVDLEIFALGVAKQHAIR